MTTLAAEELKTTLTESVTLLYDRIYHIEGVKIKLVMYGAPLGTFTLSFKSGANTLASADFTSADIKTGLNTAHNYAWLYMPLNFNQPLPVKKGTYDLVLSSSGYSYSSISFLAWVKSHENIFNERTDAFVDYTSNPLDVLIYESFREDLIK